MRTGEVVDVARGTCLIPRTWMAVSTWERMRGLLGRPPLQAGEGLWIEPCRMVHTFGMRYTLDLAFIDPRGRVCKLARAVEPGRLAGSVAARSTLEMRGGAIAEIGLEVGDTVCWSPGA